MEKFYIKITDSERKELEKIRDLLTSKDEDLQKLGQNLFLNTKILERINLKQTYLDETITISLFEMLLFMPYTSSKWMIEKLLGHNLFYKKNK